MERRFLHQEYISILWILFGLPILVCFVSIFSAEFETGFTPVHLTAVTLLILGAGYIIKSKSGELFTSRWKQLGPPIDPKRKNSYTIGYIMYLFGLAIMLVQLYGTI